MLSAITSLILAVSGLVTAVGGLVGIVVTAKRASPRERSNAAETALNPAAEGEPHQHNHNGKRKRRSRRGR